MFLESDRKKPWNTRELLGQTGYLPQSQATGPLKNSLFKFGGKKLQKMLKFV